ncbi:MAG: transposase [Verrucomicrobiales bacterium]|nr:transposase [Verrucomicrobiales bacterium]
MNLLDFLQKQTAQWQRVFPQARTLQRAVALGFGILCGLGKRTITRAISFQGNTQKDWSADYKVFSRSPWEARELFTPILEHAVAEHKLQRLVFSADDTRVWRNGKHVPHTQWHRDPMGPPFQTNLRWGHRFLQASLVLPFYKEDSQSSSRSIPVRFEMAPAVKKPGKKATEEAWTQYHKEKKEKNLSVQFVALTRQLRQHLNQSGHADKTMTMVVDASFCNKTVFACDWNQENVSIVTRCRKDIVLCKRAPGKGPRFYGKKKFTPEMVRKRDSIAPWQITKIFHGGCYREVRYKELSAVYWQGGARKKPVRLLVVAPVGYRTSKNGRKYYRQSAYLLTTDLSTPAAVLLQDYFDRWGIEINHRDEKEILGVGQAQVWNDQSVCKVPALLVAMYSWLLLAGLACYGSRRTAVFDPLPKWRRGAKRPSCLDLVTLLRKQLDQQSTPFPTAAAPPTYQAMVGTAAA